MFIFVCKKFLYMEKIFVRKSFFYVHLHRYEIFFFHSVKLMFFKSKVVGAVANTCCAEYQYKNK